MKSLAPLAAGFQSQNAAHLVVRGEATVCIRSLVVSRMSVSASDRLHRCPGQGWDTRLAEPAGAEPGTETVKENDKPARQQ